MRSLALVALLIAPSAWPCSPPIPYEAPGPNGLILKWPAMTPKGASAALVDDKGVVWSLPLRGSRATFSDALVAVWSSERDAVQVLTLEAPPRQLVIDVRALFRPGEEPGKPTPCGTNLVSTVRFVEGGLSIGLVSANAERREVVVPLSAPFTPVARVAVSGRYAEVLSPLLESHRDALARCAEQTGGHGAVATVTPTASGKGKRRATVDSPHAKLKQCLERALRGWSPAGEGVLPADLDFASWRD